MVIRNRPINNNHQHLCHHLNKKLLWNLRKRREKIWEAYTSQALAHNRHLMSWLLSSSSSSSRHHRPKLQDWRWQRQEGIRSDPQQPPPGPPLDSCDRHCVLCSAADVAWKCVIILNTPRLLVRHLLLVVGMSVSQSVSQSKRYTVWRWINPLLSCVLIICGLWKIIEFRGTAAWLASSQKQQEVVAASINCMGNRWPGVTAYIICLRPKSNEWMKSLWLRYNYANAQVQEKQKHVTQCCCRWDMTKTELITSIYEWLPPTGSMSSYPSNE